MTGRDAPMLIEFYDERRKPLVIDYELAVSDEEIMLELWTVRLRKALAVMSTVGLLSKLRFRKSHW